MWNNIIVEEVPATLANDADIAAFETRMKVALPPDHREFLKTLGEGVLFNHFRVFGLAKMAAEAAEFQTRWKEYFHWDGPDSALNEHEVGDCVIIGDSFNADEFVLSPDHPGQIFYLPADDDNILKLGPSLEQAFARRIDELLVEIETYPDDEKEEWDLRPVFNRESF